MNAAVFEEITKRCHRDYVGRESTEGIFAAIYGLVRLTRPKVAVECGCYTGETTAWIARALEENGSGIAVAYDSRHEYIQAAEKLLDGAGLLHLVAFIVDDCTTMTAIPCDFAFIDIEPKSDYPRAFARLDLAPGGIVCAHDLTFDGAGDAVRDFGDILRAKGYEVIGFPQERGLLVARRPE